MDTQEINVIDFFNKDGLLAGHMPRYEFRESQVQMAGAVEKVLEEEEHLMVEADTGVGKSIAYLVPSILWAVKNEKKVVVSTNTINLQEQLVYKDLPLLEKVIPHPFNAVLVKGRGNYICLRRFQRALEDEQGALVPSEYRSQLIYLEKWIKKTVDGSLADMVEQPHQQLWDEICCELDNCLGKKCPFYPTGTAKDCNACFFQRARSRIYKADLLIVNHHLFFSDLALRKIGRSLLPNYDAVILDEAHFVEDVATEHLGFEVSNLGVRYLLNKLYNPKATKGVFIYMHEAKGIEIVSELHKLADKFFNTLDERLQKVEDGIIRLTKPGEIPDVLGPRLMDLYKELKDIKERVKENNDLSQEVSQYIRRTSELIEELSIFRNQTLTGYVYWMELQQGKYRRIILQAYPVVVSMHLKALLFDNIKTVILTGATISVNKSFEYFKTRLGASEINELRLGSSFDYKRQMKIYVPKDIPSPKEMDKYKEALIEKINKYLDYTGGKAFVLFTNYKLMKEVYTKVVPELEDKGINSFIQGEGLPRHIMLQRFREDIDSVLFGTDSFWTGVDVEGEALSNVIITRLPFAVPEHPLMRARIDYIEEQGGNAFMDYSLPQAVIKLRQGVGRLIRSKTDKGIIVILDNRIINSHYGRLFWDSLPDCPRIIE